MGNLEEVPTDEINKSDAEVLYLPHHDVVNKARLQNLELSSMAQPKQQKDFL